MLSTDYWKKEIEYVSELAPPGNLGGVEDKDPHIMAALIVARQLQIITAKLSKIEERLSLIEASIN